MSNYALIGHTVCRKHCRAITQDYRPSLSFKFSFPSFEHHLDGSENYLGGRAIKIMASLTNKRCASTIDIIAMFNLLFRMVKVCRRCWDWKIAAEQCLYRFVLLMTDPPNASHIFSNNHIDSFRSTANNVILNVMLEIKLSHLFVLSEFNSWFYYSRFSSFSAQKLAKVPFLK